MYIISLSRSGMDDTGLSELISALPERCIALMEDIDAAFHHGLTRESAPASFAQTIDPPEQHPDGYIGPPVPAGTRVSLSGLLNALDGIGAQEGRVLFATTNKYSSLDPALCRPGRMDLHIEFKLASGIQAEELFKRFYAPAPASAPAPVRGAKSKQATTSGKHENGRAGVDVDMSGDHHSGDLIDLSEAQSQTPSCPSSSPSSPPSHSPTLSEKSDESLGDCPGPGPAYVGVSHRARAPTLSRDRISALAAQFALAVPERQVSMASLQGFLMMHKARPFGAVAGIGAWVEKELAESKGDEKGEA